MHRREEEPRRLQRAASSSPQSRPARPGSPNRSCSSSLGVWCDEGDAGKSVSSMSFAQPFAVGVGEPGLGPTPPPLRSGRAGGSQGGRLLQSERNSTLNRQAAADQKKQFVFFCFCFFKFSSSFAPSSQLVLQIKPWCILGYLVHSLKSPRCGTRFSLPTPPPARERPEWAGSL